jgi:ABC-type antimicrobial peptide transport system permease subunit
VVRQGLRLSLLGVVVGLGGAAVLTPALKPVLYGVSATDAPTFVLVPLLLVLVACVAAFLPARRAALLDPLRALRQP